MIAGAVDPLELRDRAAWEAASALPVPSTTAELVGALVFFVDDSLSSRRVETTARFTFFAETATNPELAEKIGMSRQRILEWATRALQEIGVQDAASTARTLSHYLDGLMMHKIATRDTSERPTQQEVDDLTSFIESISAAQGTA